MSDMYERLGEKSRSEEENVRAADPEEGITSYQTAHAWEVSQAEGERPGELPEDAVR